MGLFVLPARRALFKSSRVRIRFVRAKPPVLVLPGRGRTAVFVERRFVKALGETVGGVGNGIVGLADGAGMSLLRNSGGMRTGAALVEAGAVVVGGGTTPGAGGVFCPWAWPARRIPVTNTAVDFTVFMDQGFFAGAAGAPGFLATGFFW